MAGLLLFLLTPGLVSAQKALPTPQALEDSIRSQTLRIAYKLVLQRATPKTKKLIASKINRANNFRDLKKYIDGQTFFNDVTNVSDLKSLVANLSAWKLPTAGPVSAGAIVPQSVMALPVFQQKIYNGKKSVIEIQISAYIDHLVEAGQWDGLKAQDGMFGRVRYAIQQNGVPLPAGGENLIFGGLLALGLGGVYLLLRKKKTDEKQPKIDNRQQITEGKQPKTAEKPTVETVMPRVSAQPDSKPTVPPVADATKMGDVFDMPTIKYQFGEESKPENREQQTIENRQQKTENREQPTENREQRTEKKPAVETAIPRVSEPPKRSVMDAPELSNPISEELRKKAPPAHTLKMPENQAPVNRPVVETPPPPPLVETPIAPPPPRVEVPETFPEPVARLYFGFPDDNGIYDPAAARQRYLPGRTYLEMNVLPGEKTAWFRLCEEIDTAMARNLVLQWPGIAPVCYAESLSDAVLRFDTTKPGLADWVNGSWVCSRKAQVKCVEA